MNNRVSYNIGTYKFEVNQFFPKEIFYKITEQRIKHRNEIFDGEYKNRKKRKFPWDSHLVIIAADHPARGVTRVGENEIAMANRHEYLGRIIRVLMVENVDGIMTTPDIMDDLFILDYIFKQKGGESLLDNKILIGCTNRGGLFGSPYEMYDPVTAYNIEDIKKHGIDGAKMMVRLDFETKMAKYSQKTLEICSNLIRECNHYNLPAFIEPLPVQMDENGKYKVKKDAKEIIKTIGIATALGGSSANIWLKLPYIDDYETVSLSTTLPIMILGGESIGNPLDLLINFEKGIKAGDNVRGCLAGRNILYPGDDDPRAIALAVNKIVHDHANINDAIKILELNRGKKMNFLTSKGL